MPSITYQRQSTVPTHAVASNADPAAVQHLEVLKQSLGELLRNVGVHVVALVVGLLGGIDVEAGARSKVVGVVLALDVQAACKWLRKHRLAIVSRH